MRIPATLLYDTALRMLVDLYFEAANPDSGLPAHLDFGMGIDPKRRRIRIGVFGCADTDMDTERPFGSVVWDLPEILAAFASNYGGEEDPHHHPFAAFHVVVAVYDEADQQTHAHERNTVTTYFSLGADLQTTYHRAPRVGALVASDRRPHP